MTWKQRGALAGILLALAGPLVARPAAEGPPKAHVPKSPPTKAQLDGREARRLYALGILQERRNRLLEAVDSFEAAHKLDPDAPAILRSLAGLYLALDRVDDALAACEKVLRLAPDDYRTAHVYARQLRGQDRNKEAVAALKKALRSPRLKERPDDEAQLWFDLGLMQEQDGDAAGAVRSLRRVAAILAKPGALVELGAYSREQIAEQLGETHERLGRLCLKAGQVDQAVKDFALARKHAPERGGRLSFHLAQVLAGKKRPKDALAHLEEHLRGMPSGTEGYELKAKLLRQLGRAKDVVPQLEKACARDPNNLALKLLLAREYRAAKQTAEAEKAYDELLKEQVSEEVYRGLFALYRDMGAAGAEKALTRLDEAADAALGDEKKAPNRAAAARAQAMIAALRDDAAAVKLILEAGMTRLEAKKLSYAARGVLATLARQAKQLDTAEKLYRASLNRPGGPGALEAEVYAGLLRVLRAGYKHAEVVEVCRRGLKAAQQTNRVLFHTEMARAYQLLGKDKEAGEAAELACKEAGKKEDLFCRRVKADVLSAAGRHEEALALCRELLKAYNHGGDLRDVRVTLSAVYQAMGKYDEAEAQLRKVLESAPHDATANNDLGYLMADRNKGLAEAERLIRKALELDKQLRGATAAAAGPGAENAAYVDSLGWVLFRRGKLDEARRELERASRLPDGEDDPVVWDHLGDVLFRQKQPAKAAEAWRKALALYDKGTRRKPADRYKEIQGKLRLVKP